MTEASPGGSGGEERGDARARHGGGRGRALVILPTYNEVENLGTVVPRVLAEDPRLDVLVIDDASPDGTGELAARLADGEPRVRLLRRPAKLGLGSAYLTGFREGIAAGYDLLFEMDADLSHDAKYLPDFLRAAETHDLVVGSRYLRGVNVVNWPMGRLLLSWFANKYARWVTGLPLTDSTSGFKCFRREVLEAIDFEAVESTGYAFQIEMNFRAWKRGFRIAEIPIVFVDRETGSSKMTGAIVREAVWRVWSLRLRAWFGRL